MGLDHRGSQRLPLKRRRPFRASRTLKGRAYVCLYLNVGRVGCGFSSAAMTTHPPLHREQVALSRWPDGNSWLRQRSREKDRWERRMPITNSSSSPSGSYTCTIAPKSSLRRLSLAAHQPACRLNLLTTHPPNVRGSATVRGGCQAFWVAKREPEPGTRAGAARQIITRGDCGGAPGQI